MKRLTIALCLAALLSLPVYATDGVIWADSQPTPTPTPIVEPTPQGFAGDDPNPLIMALRFFFLIQ